MAERSATPPHGIFALAACAVGFIAPRAVVDRLAENVEHASENFRTYGNGNRSVGGNGFETALEAVDRVHRDGSDSAVSKLLLDFENDGLFAVFHFEGVVNVRNVSAFELNVDDDADNLLDDALFHAKI